MRKRRLIAAACTAFLLVLPSPLLAAKSDELEKTKQDLQKSQQRKEELQQQQQKLESELPAIQKKLVDLAAEVQKSEKALTASEEKLEAFTDELTRKTRALESQKKRLSALMQAALKLSQMPPEAVVMMPGDVTDGLKASRAVKMSAQSIRDKIAGMQTQVKELKLLEEKIASRHQVITKQKEALGKENKALVLRLEERRTLGQKLSRQQAEEAKKIEELSKKAEDLQSLVAGIEKVAKELLSRQDGGGPAQKGRVRSFAKAKGYVRLPLAGKLVQRFGKGAAHDEKNKGIQLQARAGAPVVAPYDGEVVFAGSFLNYGKMVIVRHSDNFHTLLAGMKTIDTRSGEFLLEGEPIGAMGDKESENRLYLELRKNNQPVDPEPWLDDRT